MPTVLGHLSEVNRMLVHATSEDELLQAICQIIVEHRGYRLAWVGYVQQMQISPSKSWRVPTMMKLCGCMHLTWAETERAWAERTRRSQPAPSVVSRYCQ